MSDPIETLLQSVTVSSRFSVSIEENIQGFVMINGREYSLPVQLQAWAKFALEIWISTRTGSTSGGPSSKKPGITVVHDGAVVRKIFVTAERDWNHSPLMAPASLPSTDAT